MSPAHPCASFCAQCRGSTCGEYLQVPRVLHHHRFSLGDPSSVQQLEPTAMLSLKASMLKVSLQAGGVYIPRLCAQEVFSIRSNTLRAINKHRLSLETAALRWPEVTIAALIVPVAFSLQLPAIFRHHWMSSYPWAVFSCHSPLSPVNICKICCSGYLQEFSGIADY